jgi:hypothetical protein
VNRRSSWLLASAFALAGAAASFAQDDDDDKAATAKPAAAVPGAQPVLAQEQQSASGIVVAHPRAARSEPAVAAFGQVLDPSVLVVDAGQLEAARAGERATAAEVARLQALYRGEANASLKMVQAAQAEQVRARAQLDAATVAFATRWGALAKMPEATWRQLLDDVASVRCLLVRADLLGRRSLGELPQTARLDVDGVLLPARVLGTLAQAAETQGAGLLLQVERPPPGFGPGARVPVALESRSRSGMLVPASALIHAEDGTHVYRQLPQKDADGRWRYEAVKVELLQPRDDAWLVGGLDDEDLVVVHGAGVLWSLQGLDAAASDDDD